MNGEFSGIHGNSSGRHQIRPIENPFIPLFFHWKTGFLCPDAAKKTFHAFFFWCGILMVSGRADRKRWQEHME